MKTLLKDIVRPIYHFIKSKNRREFLRLLDKYRDRYVEESEVTFLEYKFSLPDVRSFAFQYRDYFVENTLKFEASSEKPVIYDCGANVGTTCLYFKTLYPNARIKAFEADPKIFSYLQKNMKKNNICVDIYNKAVWVNTDGVEFSQEGADAGSVYGDKKNKIKIESFRLRDMLALEEKVDMLKIDIEGAEVDVIADCDEHLDRVEKIYMEYHSFRSESQGLDNILRILSKNNFRYHFHTFQMRKSPFIDTGDSLDIDILMIIFAWK